MVFVAAAAAAAADDDVERMILLTTMSMLMDFALAEVAYTSGDSYKRGI